MKIKLGDRVLVKLNAAGVELFKRWQTDHGFAKAVRQGMIIELDMWKIFQIIQQVGGLSISPRELFEWIDTDLERYPPQMISQLN